MKERLRRLAVADYCFVLAIVILAALLRVSFIGFESSDFTKWTGVWYDAVKANGASSLNASFSNYSPLYIYCIYVVTKVLPGLTPVATVKFVPVLFDFVLAYFGYLIVRLRYGRHSPFPFFAFCAILFAPGVMLNSAFWGQADSVFTAGLIACIYFVMRKRESWAWAAFGLALAFKFQAIFLAPFLLALLLRGLLSWRRVLVAPLVYVLSFVPAFIAGRPVVSLVTVYLSQAGQYRDLTRSAPNLYTWLPADFYDWFYPAGMILAASIVLFYIAAVYKGSLPIDSRLLVLLALVSVLIVPYFTPKMHQRYFFPADVMAIIYGFYFARQFWVPLVVCLASLFSYERFLFGQEPFLLSWVAVVLLFVIGFLVWQMLTMLYACPVSATEAQPETATTG